MRELSVWGILERRSEGMMRLEALQRHFDQMQAHLHVLIARETHQHLVRQIEAQPWLYFTPDDYAAYLIEQRWQLLRQELATETRRKFVALRWELGIRYPPIKALGVDRAKPGSDRFALGLFTSNGPWKWA